jgi:hypothetical protein
MIERITSHSERVVVGSSPTVELLITLEKTMSDELTSRISEKREQIRKLENELSHLIQSCTHECLNSYAGESYCVICRRGFGWLCKESPDKVCHYYSNDKMVELINGKLVPIPSDHDPKYETDDACIYCGEPEERK